MTLCCAAIFFSFDQKNYFSISFYNSQRVRILSRRQTLEERSICMMAKERGVLPWALSAAVREVWGLWCGQCRAQSRLCWPLCGQLGQAPFLRKQSGSGSSRPFVVLPTRWSVEVSAVTEPVCNRLVFHGPVQGLLAGLPEVLTRVAAAESQWKEERQEAGGLNGRVTLTALLLQWVGWKN